MQQKNEYEYESQDDKDERRKKVGIFARAPEGEFGDLGDRTGQNTHGHVASHRVKAGARLVSVAH